MRNEQYELTEILPKNIRMEVYKEALKFIKCKEEKYGLYGKHSGLCLILPCILWDLDTYLSDDPNDNQWEYFDTSTAFPEISEILNTLSNSELSIDDKVKLRIEFLENLLKSYDVHIN